MPKALFIAKTFPSSVARNQTGGTISNRNLFRTIASRYDVAIHGFDQIPQDDTLHVEPYKVTRQQPPAWRAPSLLLNWQPFVRRTTLELMQGTGNPDVLFATTSTLAAFDVAPPKTKCLAIVQAFENFGWRCPWVPTNSRIDLTKGALLRRFEDGRLLRRADGILTNSNFMKAAIASRFGISTNRIHVLRLLVDFSPTFENPPDQTVGFVHRGPDKNIAHVLELARKAPDLKFLVYGHLDGIPASLPDNVSVLGWASNRASMFASAKLWLVPSLWAEPFGRVSIEAQAAGRAVLVANRGGLPETVADARYLIDGFDPNEWVDRMRDLLCLTDIDLRDSRDRIQKDFSLTAHDESVWAAMEAIVGSS